MMILPILAASLILAVNAATQVTDNDRIACSELRTEYSKACQDSGKRKEEEFCQAFENVCVALAHTPTDDKEKVRGGEDEDSPTDRPHRKRVDFSQFCRQFKNRYLFVCPNPFRFGQKAVVFCPIYSERCDVPLPEKPVVPTHKPKGNASVQRLCASYANFARSYCSNPLFLAQEQYRTACEKYWRFCTPRQT